MGCCWELDLNYHNRDIYIYQIMGSLHEGNLRSSPEQQPRSGSTEAASA